MNLYTYTTAPGSVLPAYWCQGHGSYLECGSCMSPEGYDENCDHGTVSYCDGTCASAHNLLEQDIQAHRAERIADSAERITLELMACDGSASWVVTFEGPTAEAAALAYYERFKSSHDVAEAPLAPFSGEAFPALNKLLYPLCHHGLSATWCADPINHYAPDYYDL